MSEERTINIREIRRIIRVLENMRELSREAVRRGFGQEGQSYLFQQFNGIIGTLGDQGVSLPPYFPPLDPNATLDALSFASAQLAAYLLEFVEAEEAASEPASPGEPRGSILANFLHGVDFRQIDETARAALRGADEATRAALRTADEATRAAMARAQAAVAGAWSTSEGGPAAAGAAPAAEAGPSAEQQRQLAEISARIQAVAQEMQQPGLPPDELQRLAAELARLGAEQRRRAEELAAQKGFAT